MISHRKLLCTVASIIAFGAIPAASAEPPKIVIEAIIDNGGTVMDEGAQEVINSVVGGLTSLHGRAFGEARIDLILTSHPTTVFSSTPRDLIQQGQTVLDLVKLNDRCSDISRALRQAEQNLKVARAKETYLVIYSPMINAPFPCDQGPGITLPQPVPEGIAIGRMIDEYGIRALEIFGVHPSQEPVWSDFLIKQGVLKRAEEGNLTFEFLGFQQSKAFLLRHKLISRREG